VAVASIVIAVAALIFTVSSFWWIHARRGKLSSFPVQTFSGYLKADSAAVRLPISIFNDGALPIVVADLQLRLQSPDGREYLMHCRTFRKSLRPESDDVDDFAHPVSVPGRTVVSRHVEFAGITPPEPLLSGAPLRAIVEGQLDHEDYWSELVAFTLHIEIMAHVGSYITYSNHEHVWSTGLREEAVAAHTKLLSEIQSN
jgi:hypothetical protein